MKTNTITKTAAPTVLLIACLLLPQTAHCFYNPSTGRWLSRDPIGEKGGNNLYALVRNRPVTALDLLGLSYRIVNLSPPAGFWVLSIAKVTVGDITLAGFHSKYIPSDGKNGRPTCPCERQNIVLVQAINDALGHPTQYDTDAGPGKLPEHRADDPVPGYNPVSGLTIIDAPHFPQSPSTSGNWDIEDCAICRTHPDSNSTLDQVLGCVTFRFHRTDQNSAAISGHPGSSAAAAPGSLWAAALLDWQKRGGQNK
jgi:hypothetical protein